MRQPSVGRSLGLAIAGLLAAVIGVGLWLTMPPNPIHQSLEPFPTFFDVVDPECAALTARPESLPGASPYKIDDCEDKAVAQRKGYRDLDQAMRSANAAEDAAWLSLLQARASVIGAAFLVLTLFATAWAAWAAADAAKIAGRAAAAAQVSADISQREFSLTHRPRLRVRKVLIPTLTEGEPIRIQAEIANVGNTTAILRFVAFRIETRPRTLGAAARWTESDNIGAASTRHDKDGKPVILMCFIRAGGTHVQRLTTNLRYRRESGCPPELMIVRGDIAYDDTFLGSSFDLKGRMDFKPTERKTAFERFFVRHERSGVIWFAKAKEPDPEFEYED